MLTKCQEFHNNPNINPYTGRKIGVGGKPYRDLIRECGSIPTSPKIIIPNIILPQATKPQIIIPPKPNIILPQAFNTQIIVPKPNVIPPIIKPQIIVPKPNIIPQIVNPNIIVPKPNIILPQAVKQQIVVLPKPNIIHPIIQPTNFSQPFPSYSPPIYQSAPNYTPPQFIPQEEQITKQEVDILQYEIFLTVYNKYILADKIFEKNKTKAKFMKDTNQITERGYGNILNVINLWEQMYYRLANDVTNKREFTEKAGQGKLPRRINNSKDWAEAIIELVDTVNKYGRDVDLAFSINSDPVTLKKECNLTDVKQCQSPCIIDRGYFTPNKCTYQQ